MSNKTVPAKNNPIMVANSEESGTPSNHRSGPRNGDPGDGVGKKVMKLKVSPTTDTSTSLIRAPSPDALRVTAISANCVQSCGTNQGVHLVRFGSPASSFTVLFSTPSSWHAHLHVRPVTSAW